MFQMPERLLKVEPHFELLALLIFVFAVYGLANAIAVLKFGQLFFGIGYCTKEGCDAKGHPKELRVGPGRIPWLGDIFYCPPCLAFWIGMVFSLVVLSPTSVLTPVVWKATVMDGLVASGAIWLLHLIAERLAHQLKV
jgi:hypothetical protein